MPKVLEDVRKLAHGTYDDVIVVEHRKPTGADGLQVETSTPHLVLEFPEGTRVIDDATEYEVDGVVGHAAPPVGQSYRLVVGQAGPDAGARATLRYETLRR